MDWIAIALAMCALLPQFIGDFWVASVQDARIDQDWPESGLYPMWERLQMKRYRIEAHPRVRTAQVINGVGILSGLLWVLRMGGIL